MSYIHALHFKFENYQHFILIPRVEWVRETAKISKRLQLWMGPKYKSWFCAYWGIAWLIFSIGFGGKIVYCTHKVSSGNCAATWRQFHCYSLTRLNAFLTKKLSEYLTNCSFKALSGSKAKYQTGMNCNDKTWKHCLAPSDPCCLTSPDSSYLTSLDPSWPHLTPVIFWDTFIQGRFPLSYLSCYSYMNTTWWIMLCASRTACFIYEE